MGREYRDIRGIVTLENVIESVIGEEIMDEIDFAADMQEVLNVENVNGCGARKSLPTVTNEILRAHKVQQPAPHAVCGLLGRTRAARTTPTSSVITVNGITNAIMIVSKVRVTVA